MLDPEEPEQRDLAVASVTVLMLWAVILLTLFTGAQG